MSDIYICNGCQEARCDTCSPRACLHDKPLCGGCWGECADCRREALDEGSAA